MNPHTILEVLTPPLPLTPQQAGLHTPRSHARPYPNRFGLRHHTPILPAHPSHPLSSSPRSSAHSTTLTPNHSPPSHPNRYIPSPSATRPHVHNSPPPESPNPHTAPPQPRTSTLPPKSTTPLINPPSNPPPSHRHLLHEPPSCVPARPGPAPPLTPSHTRIN
ncbi:hypothetical protein CesoFtcFv8_023714 [Champsocephalus esox]|uniref:Uncharacterized protein n=1 Tax=Champsocephalus esox TaxID=159716 RepID=A0AAN8B509_9TELE|nr:hypothetical protein CesoFtcFv8_023714 [Champsocephalus esox]